MYPRLSFLKDLLKKQSTVKDSAVFRLHYQVTVPLLLAFSILVHVKEYVGTPISCVINKESKPLSPEFLNAYCWIQTTFSIESAWLKEVGNEVPYPGVDKYSSKETKVFHAYYQWVSAFLSFQALLFYGPRYFWTCVENGRIKALASVGGSLFDSKKKRIAAARKLVSCFEESMGTYKMYYFCYVVSECMNTINAVGQFFLTNVFLGGRFMDYGAEVVSFRGSGSSLEYDPMVRIFPRMTKCSFFRFGPAGSVEKYDTICLLPINIVNEKIYIFLWFWFLVLALLSLASLVHRLILHLSPAARLRLLRNQVRLGKISELAYALKECDIGDWFVIHLLAKNLSSSNFNHFISQMRGGTVMEDDEKAKESDSDK